MKQIEISIKKWNRLHYNKTIVSTPCGWRQTIYRFYRTSKNIILTQCDTFLKTIWFESYSHSERMRVEASYCNNRNGNQEVSSNGCLQRNLFRELYAAFTVDNKLILKLRDASSRGRNWILRLHTFACDPARIWRFEFDILFR